ncbi:hypothetical protein BpHYR1_028600 [Brachionus plicatilis]|uniref:Uncharacterized protein n=1 Tax=Brachionus plicatilis TaxID=10195 RepID=A0A3M7QQS7_BRAPC|nr:hypothetical protein BpHYR1_028600 [Brachionus plicatilis]
MFQFLYFLKYKKEQCKINSNLEKLQNLNCIKKLNNYAISSILFFMTGPEVRLISKMNIQDLMAFYFNKAFYLINLFLQIILHKIKIDKKSSLTSLCNTTKLVYSNRKVFVAEKKEKCSVTFYN